MMHKYWVVFGAERKGATGISYHVVPLNMEKPITWDQLVALSDEIAKHLQSEHRFIVKVVPVNIIPFKEDGTI